MNLAIRAVLCVNSGAFLLQPYTSFGQVLLCQFAFSLADADSVSWPAFAVPVADTVSMWHGALCATQQVLCALYGGGGCFF